MRIGVPVPETYVVGCEVFERFKARDEMILDQLTKDLARVIEPGVSYAVRSSSNLEDEATSSFAGQFISLLNVFDVNGVLDAIQKVWSASENDAVASYKLKRDMVDDSVQMGVILQKMVKPRLSGVALSRNPVTGEKEIIIEAVEGLGELLMQKGATPLRWVFPKDRTSSIMKEDDSYDEIAEDIAAQTTLISRKIGRAHV